MKRGDSFLWILLLLVVYLYGCSSTLSRQQCEQTDWRKTGFSDGLNGKSLKHYFTYATTCQKLDILLNSNDDYSSGWVQGNNQYCKASNGFTSGRHGENYIGVCANNNEQEFLNAYVQGLNIYTLDVRFNDLQHQLNHSQQKLMLLLNQQNNELKHQIGVLANKVNKLSNEIKVLKSLQR